MVPPGPAGDNCLWERTARIDFISTATFAALVLAVAGASLWHTTGFDARTTAATTAAATPSASAHAPPAPAEAPRPPPLQVLNPFDPTEVFELPAETTESEAREAVADLLLQRARSRLAQTGGPKHTSMASSCSGRGTRASSDLRDPIVRQRQLNAPVATSSLHEFRRFHQPTAITRNEADTARTADRAPQMPVQALDWARR